ncbi:MAG: hypothetical protein KME15_15145 [Drouetiella hepatica Uher 2000/2452]|jgi:hypothetical protein|uniref:NHLP bacteriocin system secretion protein n=1 Tax=Drouetiella hepatica Uher 2000/2452 TaxID=904376 RepID=A0A951QDN6_9CYAN|nr:hypothetical protein [Drouetiella hepatica Uher 2000/2452]
MASEQESLFRKEALEQVSSPEQLDQLMQVVNLRDWLPLASIGFLVTLALLWSVIGRIPIFVESKGLLIKNRSDSSQLTSVSYFPIVEGKQIQVGDRILIIPETNSIQEFGGLEATVTEVSPSSVTQASALKRVDGNLELAELVYTPASIEVLAQLKPNPENVTGYEWSMSKGPSEKLSGGTPVTARVTLSDRAPISFVFPFLK